MIVLHTTHCPKCKILKKKLNSKEIKYEENSNTDLMVKMGIDILPVLEIDGKLLDFIEAVKWVNEQ